MKGGATMNSSIQLQGPYNFDHALKRLETDPLNVVNQTKREVKIPLIVNETSVVVDVQATGTTEHPSFDLSISSSVDKKAVLTRLYEVMHFDVPLKNVANHFKAMDLYPLIRESYGIPFITDFQLYGCLMKTIIHQQLNMKFGITLTERFVKSFGENIHGVPFFPKPETVGQLHVDELRKLQFSQRKAEYVIDTSQMIAEGKLDFTEIKRKSDDEIIEELTKIRGIGRWTAENFMMFGLGRLDLFPKQDIGVQNALKRFYQLEKKPSFEFMEKIAGDWSPYRSYATLYLWNSLENGTV